MELFAVLTHAEEGGYMALNPETGTTTQGETVEEAVANLQEAAALYLSESPMPSLGHPVVATFTVPALHMPELPHLSGAEIQRTLVKIGPLAGLLRQAEVTAEEFMRVLRK